MKFDILIAHPGKHHVLHLVAGCVKSGVSVCYIAPLYKCGLGSLITSLPGSIGNKAKGYFHADIPSQTIVSPIRWQLIKLWSLYKNDSGFESAFDLFVANKIDAGKYPAKVVVTLQDYMPNTVRAAKKQGSMIWSDQILNQSEVTSLRIMRHEKEHGLPSSWQHSEKCNGEIIAISSLITVPSTYCLEGIYDHINSSAKVSIAPYGANAENFATTKKENSTEIVILARAHSVRKGGHLFLQALDTCGEELLKLCRPRTIKVIILGNIDSVLQPTLKNLTLPNGLTIEHGNVAHSLVPKLYQRASLFVMPSLSESMSLACIEAMHAELPLIITPYCGIDGFKQGQMGYEISDTAESLVTAMVNAFKNQASWSIWGRNAKRLANQLTWSEYESSISRLAKNILA